MKVLVIGSGAREHALAWKLLQSDMLTHLYCAPGNGGMAELAQCVDIKGEDVAGLLDFALRQHIDLTVVGPEVSLALGIVDAFEEKGLKIFGPNSRASQLESSKSFAKSFMEKHGIPTAKYRIYHELAKAVEEIGRFGLPVVIKADGLAAGKGVVIAQSRQEAVACIREMMEDKKFGKAGSTIVIEEFLRGPEVSVLAFGDGNTLVPMASAQDYKRVLEGDQGLNTGGMGAVSPAFYYTREAEEQVRTEILQKTSAALKAEGIAYKGVLYFGLMLTPEGPKVLEFNVRFGDPETEAILPRLQSDLLELMQAAIEGNLAETHMDWAEDAALCVVLASGGYPEAYDTGYEIRGLKETSEALIFHAGTKLHKELFWTAGGRVLAVTALGADYNEAAGKAYAAIEKIKFEKMHFRRDIGQK
jgi:phosphoribosylamine--glycine ligase